MKKLLLALAVAFAYASLFASFESVELGDGGTWLCGAPCRVAAVRAVSTGAAGTVALSAVETYDVATNAAYTVTDTEVLWRRVATNGTTTVTNDYSGQVVFTAPPPWGVAWTGWITNTTTRTLTRLVKTGQTIAATNSLASLTCSAGAGSAAPSNVYVRAGDRVLWTGTAKGRVTIIVER